MIEWVTEISDMTTAKQIVRERDSENLWRAEPSRAPAAAALVNSLDQRIETEIDEEYASFLLHADGWPAVLQDIDLFGTPELFGPQFARAKELVGFLEPDVLEQSNVEPGGVVPIALSRTGTDVFVMPRRTIGAVSPVIWFTGIEVARYGRFSDFFRAMREENIAEASDLGMGR